MYKKRVSNIIIIYIPAQLWGTIGIRLADAHLLPYNYTNYAVHLQHFLLETHKLLEQENGTTYVDLSPVKEAISIFTSAAQKQESGALITDGTELFSLSLSLHSTMVNDVKEG